VLLWGLVAWMCAGIGLTALAFNLFVRDEADAVVVETIGPVSEPHKGFDFGTGMTPAFRVAFKNQGSTQVEHVWVNVTLRLSADPLPVRLPIDHTQDIQLPPITPSGRQFKEAIFHKPLNKDDVAALNVGALKFHVFGSLKYGSGPYVEFCRVFNPELGRPGGRPYLPPDMIFEPCPTPDAAARLALEKLAEETALQTRPYVDVVNPVLSPLVVGQNPVAHVTIKNTGKTPAVDVMVGARLQVGDFPLFTNIAYEAIDGPRVTLGSGEQAQMQISSDTVLTAAELAGLKTGMNSSFPRLSRLMSPGRRSSGSC